MKRFPGRSVFCFFFFGIFAVSSSVQAAVRLYIPNQGSNTVSVIDGTSHTVVSTINVGTEPYGVGVSPDQATVYITNLLADTVSVINTPTSRVTATIKVGDFPFGVTVCPDGRYAYVANGGDGAVSVIDTATNAVVASIPVGLDPHGVVCSPDSSRLYVSNYSSGSVSVIDTASRRVTRTISVGGGPHGIFVSEDGTKAYVANVFDGTVSVINTTSNTVTATVPAGKWPFVPALSPTKGFLYVSSAGTDSLAAINTASNTPAGGIAVGLGPHGVGFSPDGKYAYSANEAGRTVSVVDTSTNTLTRNIPVGTKPIAFGDFVVDVPLSGTSMAVPSGAGAYAYGAVKEAGKDGTPAAARPVALGSVAEGGATLSHGVDAYDFKGPVDAYLGLIAPSVAPGTILLFTPAGIQPITEGILPWKSGVSDISGAALPDLPVSLLPSGTYTFLLLVVPRGTPVSGIFNNYYLWSSTYTVLRASEVADQAVTLLGDETSAVVAVLFALDKGHTLTEITNAVAAGTLTQTGDIPATKRSGLGVSSKGRFNDRFCDHPEDDAKCEEELENFLSRLNEDNESGATYLAGILTAGQNGYTAEQITEGFIGLYQGAVLKTDVSVGQIVLRPMLGVVEVCVLVSNPPTGPQCDEWEYIHPRGTPQKVFSCEEAEGPDTDGDGVRDVCDSDDDGDGVPDAQDCDPTDVGRFPGNFEFCGDGIDQDCNGSDLVCAGCFPDTGCCTDTPYICGDKCIGYNETCMPPAPPAPVCAPASGCCATNPIACGGDCFAAGTVCCGNVPYEAGTTCCAAGNTCAPGFSCCADGCMPGGATCCPGGVGWCDAGMVCTSWGCMPEGYTDCGYGACPPGKQCTPTGCL